MTTKFEIVEPTKNLKLLIWGEFKVGKTTLAMQFPGAVVMDLEKGSTQYQKRFGVPGLLINEGDFEQLTHACTDAIKQGFQTIIVDSASLLWEWHQERWSKLYLQNEPKSRGNKREYYRFQPNDYGPMKRGWRLYIQSIIKLPANIIFTARSKPLYAEGQMMKQIGDTCDCEKNLPYEFDYIVQVVKNGNRRDCILGGERCVDPARKLPERFPLNDAMKHFNMLLGVDKPKPVTQKKETANAS